MTTVRHPAFPLLTLCLAQFGLVLAFQGTALALPVVDQALHLSPDTRQWLVSANALAFGGGLLPAGRAADTYGHRRLFVIGCAIFALASCGAGLAPSIGWLIACRALQGIGTACSTPATLALLADSFPEGPTRRRALAFWGAAGPIGGIAAILLGGWLIEVIGWRAMFLLAGPIVVPAIPLALRVLPSGHGSGRAAPDVRSALAGILGIAALIVALSELASESPSPYLIAIGSFAACLLLVIFGLLDRKAVNPIVPDRLRRIPNVGTAVVVSLFHGASTNTFIVFYAIAMQELHGWSTFRTGLGFIPCNVGVITGAIVATRLAAVRGFRLAALSGMIIVVAGLAFLMCLDIVLVITGLTVAGVGLGAANIGMIGMATGAAPEDDRGAVGALVSMAAQIGTAVGIALLTILAAIPATTTASLHYAFAGGMLFASLGALVVMVPAHKIVGGQVRSGQPRPAMK